MKMEHQRKKDRSVPMDALPFDLATPYGDRGVYDETRKTQTMNLMKHL
jgi:hypothetical protein